MEQQIKAVIELINLQLNSVARNIELDYHGTCGPDEIADIKKRIIDCIEPHLRVLLKIAKEQSNGST